MELSVQNILSDELWIVCLLGASFICILDSGFDSKLSTNSQNSLVIHVNIMIPLKVISDSTVSLVRTFHMNLFYGFCNHSVFSLGLRYFMMQPFVIGGTADTADFAKCTDWIIMFFMFFLDCQIYVFVANQAQPRLLSISSNFFKKDTSISARSLAARSSFTSARSFSSSVISSSGLRRPRLSFSPSTPDFSYLIV